MFLFQGTDGVRRRVKLSTDPELSGLTPQQAFMRHGVITERFMELYTYCHVRQLIESGFISEGDRFVIGWDPRDPDKVFSSAAAHGLAKGGARVVVAGVAPTPAVALYMRYIKAAGVVVVTASHNPASYNGIKIFTRSGLKLLPDDDRALSGRVLATDYAEVERAAVDVSIEDHHDRALEVFVNYSIDPSNSWIDDPAWLEDMTIVADCANGALSEVAEGILQKAGFGEVVVVNDRLDGSVNVRSGVAELEGVDEIGPDMVSDGGRFAGNMAMVRLFEIGRKKRDLVANGSAMVCAAVFDGDGDRFYGVFYNPLTDSAFVLTGDETAALQAGYMAERGEGDGLFLNTVESDLAAAIKARELGFATELTAVGDKWILLGSFLALWRRTLPPDVYNHIRSLIDKGSVSADALERALDEAGEGRDKVSAAGGLALVGAEESGHTITQGYLEMADGARVAVFHGNGIKSCLNTFGAICGSWRRGYHADDVEPALDRIRHPFTGGFKKTLYVYYVDKSRWRRGTAVWNDVRAVICEKMAELWPGGVCEEMVRAEDADMLYMKIIESGLHTGSVFVRNSGTEDKTGVTLRGDVTAETKLLEIGGAVLRRLIAGLKDQKGVMGRAEMELLTAAGRGGAPQSPVGGLDDREYRQLLVETATKQGFLTDPDPGAVLTELGKWYLSTGEPKI